MHLRFGCKSLGVAIIGAGGLLHAFSYNQTLMEFRNCRLSKEGSAGVFQLGAVLRHMPCVCHVPAHAGPCHIHLTTSPNQAGRSTTKPAARNAKREALKAKRRLEAMEARGALT
jgi:hypothetical protein